MHFICLGLNSLALSYSFIPQTFTKPLLCTSIIPGTTDIAEDKINRQKPTPGRIYNLVKAMDNKIDTENREQVR